MWTGKPSFSAEAGRKLRWLGIVATSLRQPGGTKRPPRTGVALRAESNQGQMRRLPKGGTLQVPPPNTLKLIVTT